MTCECTTCKRHRSWRSVLVIDTPEKEVAFDNILESLIDAETDVEYYRALFRGEWPGSEDVLTHALYKIRMKNGK